MKLLVGIVLACSACTIDPVARAELAGAARGDAIFQKAGTSTQVSFEITLEGEDGKYAIAIETGACGAAATEWASVGMIDVVDGIGILRGVRSDWDIGGGDNDIVDKLVVARRVLVTAGCGEIENSD